MGRILSSSFHGALMIHSNRVIVPCLGLALVACGGDGGTGPGPGPGPETPLVLQVMSGNAQPGMPGEELWNPLVVRATRGGQPVQYELISFSATAGMISIPTGTTDADGQASVRWTLPAEEAAVAGARVRARVTGSLDSVVFSARIAGRADRDKVTGPAGVPIRMMVYKAGAWTHTGFVRHDFTDSVRLWVQPGIHDEIVAFAPGRAPLLLEPSWSRGERPVQLQFREDVIRMPITFWIVQPPVDSAVMLIERNLQGVRDSWEAQAGIGLRDVRIIDATNHPSAARFQGELASPLCDPTIFTDIGHDDGRLNVYHVGMPPFGVAIHCGEGNILFFPRSWERSRFVLAHEIGHGFFGGHHETIPDNIMHFMADGTQVSAGQMFRAHFSATSMLNTLFNAYPATMRRPCAVSIEAPSPICPPTNFVLD